MQAHIRDLGAIQKALVVHQKSREESFVLSSFSCLRIFCLLSGGMKKQSSNGDLHQFEEERCFQGVANKELVWIDTRTISIGLDAYETGGWGRYPRDVEDSITKAAPEDAQAYSILFESDGNGSSNGQKNGSDKRYFRIRYYRFLFPFRSLA